MNARQKAKLYKRKYEDVKALYYEEKKQLKIPKVSYEHYPTVPVGAIITVNCLNIREYRTNERCREFYLNDAYRRIAERIRPYCKVSEDFIAEDNELVISIGAEVVDLNNRVY